MQQTDHTLTAPRRALWPFAQAAFVAAYLVLALYSYYDYAPVMRTLFPNLAYPLIIAFATLTLTQTGYLKRWDGICLTVFCGWLVIVDWINIPSYTTYNYTVYQALCFALVIYPLAMNLPPVRRDGIIRCILHLFIALVFVLCAWGLVTVLNREVVQSPFGASMGLHPQMTNRLFLFMYPNIAGILLTISGLVSIYMLMSVKHPVARVYYALAVILMTVMLGLTDSRACMIAYAIGVACLGVVLVRAYGARLHAALRWAVSLACAAVLAIVCFFGMRLAVDLVGYGMHALDGAAALAEAMQAPPAATEDPTAGTTQSRDILPDLKTLNLRSDVWKAALQAIRDEPMILLRGTSHDLAMRKVLPYTTMAYEHMHNVFLEVLVSMGLPGLVATLGFLVLLAIRSVRLLLSTDPQVPLAARFLPAVMLSCVVISMVESQFFLTSQRFPNPLFFLLAGYITAIAEEKIIRRAPAAVLTTGAEPPSA